jgi:hypothetical protein
MASFGLGNLVGQCFALRWYGGLDFPHGAGNVVAELIPIITNITDEVGDFPNTWYVTACGGGLRRAGWWFEVRVMVGLMLVELLVIQENVY